MLTRVFAPVVGQERLNLRQTIKRLQQQTRWQVYALVLPVVFLAVIVVGGFGWYVFTRHATENLAQHAYEEAAFFVGHLRGKVLVETMGLEARKRDIARPDSLDSGWMTDLLRDDFLVGVALVGVDLAPGASGSDWRLHSMSFVDSLSGPVNHRRLETWFDSYGKNFDQNLRHTEGGLATPGGTPVLAYDDIWHPTYVFPPILIEEVHEGSQASAGGDLAALLPVLVYEADNDELYHTIYFLSLNHMLAEMWSEGGLIPGHEVWWCVVNYQGRVIDTAANVPTVGSLLKNQHLAAGQGPFDVCSGAELVGDWSMGKSWHTALQGDHMDHWMVAAGQSGDFPLAVLIGHEGKELRAKSLGFMYAVVGVALLALAIALFGVTRVVGGVSARLTNLSHNMELVAKGDYSRRIPNVGQDEVGRLNGYFNLMTTSLDETQRELSEKTEHLEAALETRQQLDRAKDNFLVLISHEVRTPLTAIMGGVDILKSLVKRTTGPEREILDNLNVTEVVSIIESSGARLRGFMNDAIEMTSIQSSDKELMLRPEPVGGLVEMGLCGVSELARLRDIEVVNGLENEKDWLVLCDARVLKLAFEKVLKNAVVHNHDEGRVVIREAIEVPELGTVGDLTRSEDVHRLMSQETFGPYAELPVEWRLVEVFNTGEAIPTERREALFGKFELVGRIEHHQRGSGLSLPIAQSVVEYHGGRICVHSVKLQGNSFYLLLPTIAASALAEQQASIEGSAQGLSPAGKQVAYGVGGRTGDKNIDQVTDSAAL